MFRRNRHSPRNAVATKKPDGKILIEIGTTVRLAFDRLPAICIMSASDYHLHVV